LCPFEGPADELQRVILLVASSPKKESAINDSPPSWSARIKFPDNPKFFEQPLENMYNVLGLDVSSRIKENFPGAFKDPPFFLRDPKNL